MSLSPSRNSALLRELGRRESLPPPPTAAPFRGRRPSAPPPVPAGALCGGARGPRCSGLAAAAGADPRGQGGWGAQGAEPQRWGRTRGAPHAGPDCTLPTPSLPGSSAPCTRILIKVLCRSAHFQPISHEEACWFRWCMESSALACLSSGPWSPDPVASTSWLDVLDLTGPTWCQKLACLLSQDVGFTSQVFPEFVKIPFLAACP